VSAGVITLAALACGTYVLKVAGPLLLGRRALPPLVARLATLMPAALLAALVITSTATAGRQIVADARVPALLVAALLLWARAPFVVVVLGAAASAAAVRALL
jgi:branched-subunit amino acid transport protein AzlD